MIVAKALEVDSAAKYAEKERKAKGNEKRKEKHIQSANSSTSLYVNNANINSGCLTTNVKNRISAELFKNDNNSQQHQSASNSVTTIEITSVKPSLSHSPTLTTKTNSSSSNFNNTTTTRPLITYAQSSVSLALSSVTKPTTISASKTNNNSNLSATSSVPKSSTQQHSTITKNALQNVIYIPLSTKTVMDNCQFSIPRIPTSDKEQKTPTTQSAVNIMYTSAISNSKSTVFALPDLSNSSDSHQSTKSHRSTKNKHYQDSSALTTIKIDQLLLNKKNTFNNKR